MNNPINDAIASALRRDGLKEGTEITGERDSGALGLMLVHDIAKQREAILSLAGDAHRSMPFDRFFSAVVNGGFDLVLDISFDGEHEEETRPERFCIFWHHKDSLLLVCDTYSMLGEQSINSGSVYYNWKPNEGQCNSRWTSSGGYTEDVFIGYHHYVAILYHMQNLRDHGKFVFPWVKRPLFWLTHWMDNRAIEKQSDDHTERAKSRDAITTERILLLPESVRKCVGK